MSEIPDNAPAPRLCIIAKWSDFEGYGFNLHAEKSKPGQYIGKVDDNSPAEMAGLKEGDRIIEVNGVNIANENHKQVVQRIKTVPNETRLLVVDTATDQYYKGKNIVVKSSQPNVITKSSVREPAPPSPKVSDDPPPYSNGHDDAADTRSVSSAASSSVASEGSTLPQPETTQEEAPCDAEEVDDTKEEDKGETPSTPQEPSTCSEEEVSSLEEKVEVLSLEEKDESSELLASAPPPPSEVISKYSSNDDDESVNYVKSPTKMEDSDHPSDEGDQESKVGENESNPIEAKDVLPSESESKLNTEYENATLANEGTVKTEDESEYNGATSTSRRSSSATSSSTASESTDTANTENTTQSPMSTSPTPPPSLDHTISKPAPSPTPSPTPTNVTSTTTTTEPVTTVSKNPPQPLAKNNSYNSGGLNLNMSAAEMRAVLARKKKVDPRKDTLDFRKKYEIIQNM